MGITKYAGLFPPRLRRLRRYRESRRLSRKVRVHPVARRFLLLFFLHFGIGCFGWAQARTVPNKPGNGPGNTTSVTIGQSSARLYGPWKFTVGDSPIDP